MATKLGPSGSIKKKTVGAAPKTAKSGRTKVPPLEMKWLDFAFVFVDLRDKLRAVRDALKK